MKRRVAGLRSKLIPTRYIIFCNALVVVTALYICTCTEMRFIIINNNTCSRLPIRAAVECAAAKEKRNDCHCRRRIYFSKCIPKSLCPHAARRRSAASATDIAPVPLRVLTHIYIYMFNL